MPYMDWEASRTRNIVSRVIARETNNYRSLQETSVLERKRGQILHRQELGGSGNRVTHDHPGMDGFDFSAMADQKATLRPSRMPAKITSISDLGQQAVSLLPNVASMDLLVGEIRLWRASPLGEYLFYAAR